MSGTEPAPRSIPAAPAADIQPVTLAAVEYGPRQRFAVTVRDGWLRIRREVFDGWSGRWSPRRAGITFSPQQTRALATAIVNAGRELVAAGVLPPISKPLPPPAANADNPPRVCGVCDGSLAGARADKRYCSAACRSKARRTAKPASVRPSRAETIEGPR